MTPRQNRHCWRISPEYGRSDGFLVDFVVTTTRSGGTVQRDGWRYERAERLSRRGLAAWLRTARHQGRARRVGAAS